MADAGRQRDHVHSDHVSDMALRARGSTCDYDSDWRQRLLDVPLGNYIFELYIGRSGLVSTARRKIVACSTRAK